MVHVRTVLSIFLLLICGVADGQIITTVVGSGDIGYNGDGIAATMAQIDEPHDITFDGSGNLYFSDYRNKRVREVNCTSGIISTIAGTGDVCDSMRDGSPASATPFGLRLWIVMDDTGNIFVNGCSDQSITKIEASTNLAYTISDSFFSEATVDDINNLYVTTGSTLYRMNLATGNLTTIAGVGGPVGYCCDGGPATNATISCGPMVRDDTGNIYFVGGEARVRKVNMATGIISTIAGNGTIGYSGDGGPATAAELSYALGIAIDPENNLYVADFGNNVIRKITASSGVITTIAGTGVAGYGPDGVPATASEIRSPVRVAVDKNGNVYFSDWGNDRIRKITYVSTLVNNVSINTVSTKIYPNPTSTTLAVSSSTPICQITISNLLGQAVFSRTYSAEKVEVDVAELPPGVYFVKVNGTEVRRFVKE